MELSDNMDVVEDTNDVKDIICVNDGESDEIQLGYVRKKSWESTEDDVVDWFWIEDEFVVTEDERNGDEEIGPTEGCGKSYNWVAMDEEMLMEWNEHDIYRGHVQRKDDEGIVGRYYGVVEKSWDGKCDNQY